MSPARQALAVAAVAVAGAIAGFAATALLSGGSGAPPPAAAAAPAAGPEEALPPPAPPAPPAPGAAPAPDAPPPVVEPDPAPAPDPPAPDVEPEPPAAPAPPEPRPDPAPEEPAPGPPAPPSPPASATAPAPPPPQGVRIPAGELPTGSDPARRALAGALERAAPGSTAAADIRRLLALGAEYAPAARDATAAGVARRATIARALRANAWWYARRGAPARRVLLRDPDGVILTYRPGQGFAVNPVATTGRWRDLNADVPAAGLADVLLPMGVPRRAGTRRFLAWEYYDVPGEPLTIRPGASGMAQARVALVMAHADAATGDTRYADAALGALAALTVGVDRGGARSMVTTREGQEPLPWYVERAHPGADAWTGGALNGFMVTLLNLRGAGALLDRAPDPSPQRATAARLARELADRGAATLARHLGDHDTGSWSLYGLLTPGRPWRTYLADLNYHCYHVRLLTQLAAPYPDAGFADTAARWQGYVDDAGAVCAPRPGDDDGPADVETSPSASSPP